MTAMSPCCGAPCRAAPYPAHDPAIALPAGGVPPDAFTTAAAKSPHHSPACSGYPSFLMKSATALGSPPVCSATWRASFKTSAGTPSTGEVAPPGCAAASPAWPPLGGLPSDVGAPHPPLAPPPPLDPPPPANAIGWLPAWPGAQAPQPG